MLDVDVDVRGSRREWKNVQNAADTWGPGTGPAYCLCVVTFRGL